MKVIIKIKSGYLVNMLDTLFSNKIVGCGFIKNCLSLWASDGSDIKYKQCSLKLKFPLNTIIEYVFTYKGLVEDNNLNYAIIK